MINNFNEVNLNNKKSFRSEVKKNNFTFQISKNNLSVRTILNKQFKINKFKKVFDIEDLKNEWKKIIKNHPQNEDYKKFYEFLKKYKQKYLKKNKKFNFLDFIIKWSNQKETWICDTETTFTSLVPENYLFKDEKLGFGKNANETIKNLHIQQIKNQNEKSKLGIKEWFKENPNLKPYMWAWNALNFETKEYIALNYYDAVNFLNNYPKRVLQYYHNLSYDAYYIMQGLIDEFDYKIIVEPSFEEKKKEQERINNLINENKELKQKHKYNFGKWIQPKKTIIVLANENKILSIKIKNAVGKIIYLQCTYLKTLASINSLGKILNKPKLEINYMTPRSKHHVFSQKELDYIFMDVDIISTYLQNVAISFKKRFNKNLNWLLTLGQTSFKMLKSFFGQEKWQEMFEYKISLEDWKDFSEEEKAKFNKKRPTLLSAEESIYLRKGTHDLKNNTWSGGFYNGGYTNYNTKYVGELQKNIASLDIKSSYPHKWQNYKMPYGECLYNCPCDNLDFSNNSTHFKLYELTLYDNLKILPNKENLLPTKCEGNNEKGKRTTVIDYYPWMLRGTYCFSQYAIKIFFTLFNPKKNQYRLKKTICFEHMVIDEFKEYVDLWKEEKEQKNLKKENPSYYDLCKLFSNGPTGKFGQKEIIEEKQFFINELGQIDFNIVQTKNFEDLHKFSYLPVIIATTDISRLHVLSLIEKIGWNNWHNSDTDSCKVWLPKKLRPEYKPKYLNLITNEFETIYNEKGASIYGKWELEWEADKFKCSGKKKYIYQIANKTKVVCAGAPQSVKNKMDFENFFIGFETKENEKNKIEKLNGMPVILPTSFKIKNVFKGKNWTLSARKSLLSNYYIKNLERIEKLIIKSKNLENKKITNFESYEIDNLNKDIGVYS